MRIIVKKFKKKVNDKYIEKLNLITKLTQSFFYNMKAFLNLDQNKVFSFIYNYCS